MASNDLNFSQIDHQKDLTMMDSKLNDQFVLEFNDLINDAKNFNLHVIVLKQLLNLEEREKGYALYMRSNSLDHSSRIQNDLLLEESNGHFTLSQKLSELKKELNQSYQLGFCLAYNVQCLQKRLTGFPIDINSGLNLIESMKERHEISKAKKAVIKYDFQEKRKLLNRLRLQLKETRDDWRNLRIGKPRKKLEEIDSLWNEVLKKRYPYKQPSEESGFGEQGCSSAGNVSDTQDSSTSSRNEESVSYQELAVAMHLRKKKLDQLEEECYNLFSNLSKKWSKSESDSHEESEESPLIDDFIDDLIVDDEDLISESFSDEMDNGPLNQIFMRNSVDDIEEATDDINDLPWDNTLNESTLASNDEPIRHSDSQSSTSESESNSDHEEDVETAETGEPVTLRILRRRAVKTLISRLSDEKLLHQSKETYLREQLKQVQLYNQDLQKEIDELKSFDLVQKWKMAIIGGVVTSFLIALIIHISS